MACPSFPRVQRDPGESFAKIFLTHQPPLLESWARNGTAALSGLYRLSAFSIKYICVLYLLVSPPNSPTPKLYTNDLPKATSSLACFSYWYVYGKVHWEIPCLAPGVEIEIRRMTSSRKGLSAGVVLNANNTLDGSCHFRGWKGGISFKSNWLVWVSLPVVHFLPP